MFHKKKVFSEISQNSQENNCTRVSILIKLRVSDLQLIKKETLAKVFSCEFYEISKNTFFTEHLWKSTSGVSPRKIIKVAPQVKKKSKKNLDTRAFFVKFWDLNPISMLQLSVYEKSEYNGNVCSVKCLGKSAAKIIQSIHKRVHIS